MTSTEQLDMILNDQRSPLIKVGMGYEGETSKSKIEDNKNIIFAKAVKDNETAQKGTTKAESSKNLMSDETNRNKQQHQETKNERKKKEVSKNLIVLEDQLNKFGGSQKRFFPPMRNVTCFCCHKLGHIAAYF